MIGIAAGLATCGKIPFAASFAMFSAGRAFEQVRNSVGYPHLNVKIAGSHAGISTGVDGATHQCCEDIALMRTIPGMVVLNPSDHYEMLAAVKAAAAHQGPVYIRLGRLAVESINNNDDYHFELGKGITLRDGQGQSPLWPRASWWARPSRPPRHWRPPASTPGSSTSTPSSPLTGRSSSRPPRKPAAIVTVEEHNIIGGLGEAVSAVVCEECPVFPSPASASTMCLSFRPGRGPAQGVRPLCGAH